MADLYNPRQNRLLAALPADEYECLFPHLVQVRVVPGEILHESGYQLHYIYFPITTIISLHFLMEDGTSAEIVEIGNEGMLGVAHLMGGQTMPSRAMALYEGYAYRLKPQLLVSEFNRIREGRTSALNNLMLRYFQALMMQISQTAVCNRHHFIEQKLCRWLLFCLDRVSTNELILTQELMAYVLGVRRESITEATGKLRQAGLIYYRRGHITVLDRAGLENRTCECYRDIKTEFDCLLPNMAVTHSEMPTGIDNLMRSTRRNNVLHMQKHLR